MLRVRGALAALVAVALTSGCTSTDDPEPVPSRDPSPVVRTAPGTPTRTPSPTPTPTPTRAAPPTPPSDLSREDEAGAAAAATYFVSLYSYVMNTGDTATWAAMSAPICGFCARISEDATAIVTNGETYTGGEITLSEIEVLTRDDLIGGFPVDAKFVQSPVRHTAPDGTVINETDGDSGVVRIDTLHTGDSWQILAVVVSDA